MMEMQMSQWSVMHGSQGEHTGMTEWRDSFKITLHYKNMFEY